MNGLRKHARVSLAGLGALIVIGAAVAAFALTRGGVAQAANRIVVSDTGCGFDWTAPHSGQTTFTVANTTAKTSYSVVLTGSDQTSIYGQIEALAPSTELPLDVVLPPGDYLFRCQTRSGLTLVSPTQTVRGGAISDASPYTPVSAQAMDAAVLTYRASLVPTMKRLVSDTGRLADAVRSGNLASARKLWLPAHLDYTQLGVAYDTFGPFNDLINERPLGLAGGVADPKFHGFLRLEYGLWHGQSSATLAPVATALEHAVQGLLAKFPGLVIPPGDLSLRAHEILENTLQFELTGETDEGSNSNLATAWANVRGTTLAVSALHPVLAGARPELDRQVTSGLTRLGALLESYRRDDGQWEPLQSLTTGQREQLDGTVSGLLEHLELIPDVLQPAPAGGGDD